MQLSCNYTNTKGARRRFFRAATLAVAAILVFMAVVLFSAWHRHDAAKGGCNFNHLDSQQAESGKLYVTAFPQSKLYRPEKMPPMAKPLDSAPLPVCPRAPPV